MIFLFNVVFSSKNIMLCFVLFDFFGLFGIVCFCFASLSFLAFFCLAFC